MSRLMMLVLLALTLCGCTGTAMLNNVAAVDDAQRAGNLIYDPERNLRLDVYAPPGTRNAPVVVFFYGGEWTHGEREDYAFVAEALNSRGFVVVIPDYRKYPAVRFPAFVEDAAAAVAWTQKNIQPYGGAPERLFVMGHSAGAHIASLLALDPDYLKDVGASRTQLRGAIGLAGPYDFMPITDPKLRDLFGPVHRFPDSQPIHFATRGAPPMLLISGEDDEVVSVSNTRNLAAALTRSNNEVETVYYPKLGHARVLGALGRPLRTRYDVLDYIDRFIRTHMDTPYTEPQGLETRPLNAGPG